MIAVVDYGVGNLFSLTASLKVLGAEAVVTGDKKIIEKADKIILPGVGAFADAAQKLKELKLDEVIKEEVKNGKSLLGICLGMQLLFEKSYEYGEHEGLKLIDGEVRAFNGVLERGYKIPHMGWNSLVFDKKDLLFDNVSEGEYVYYVHSYYADKCEADRIAYSNYGNVCVTGAVRRGNVYGTQFHPEKSGKIGLEILNNFVKQA